MKKFLLTLTAFIVALMAVSCQGQPETDFIVMGDIENVEDDYLILLFKSNHDGSTTTIAVDTLTNGHFEFTAPAETGVQYHVIAPHVGIFPSMSADFYVEPGAEIKITGKDYLTKNWTIRSDVRNQKIYQSYFELVADIYKELQIADLEYRKTNDLAQFMNKTRELNAKADSVLLKWLKAQRKITEPWMDLMSNSSHTANILKEEENLIELRNIWTGVDKKFKDTPKGNRITMALRPQETALNVGDMFPYDTEVHDIQGNRHTLSKFKGKDILVYFSSYGCKPCVEAKEELCEIVGSEKGKLEVIGLNVDTRDVWKARGKENPVPWYDFNELKGEYGLNSRLNAMGIPTFMIVSKEGIILDVWAGYGEGIIQKRIDEYLPRTRNNNVQ